MILRNEIWIRTTPEEIVGFFEGMEENYTRWHPEHRRFEWIEGRGVAEGVRCEFDEEIGGRRQRKRLVYTDVVEGRRMELVPTSRLLRLLLPRIIFCIRPDEGGCRFVQEVHVRTGPVGAWLNRKEFAAVRRHMREEGENLKALLERSG